MKIYTPIEEHQLYWKFEHIPTKISKKIIFSKTSSIRMGDKMVSYTVSCLESKKGPRIIYKDAFYQLFSISTSYFLINKKKYFNFIWYLLDELCSHCDKVDQILIMKYILQDYCRYKEKYKYNFLQNTHRIEVSYSIV